MSIKAHKVCDIYQIQPALFYNKERYFTLFTQDCQIDLKLSCSYCKSLDLCFVNGFLNERLKIK